MLLSGLLLLLLAFLTSSTDVVRPGALVTPEGKVIIVEDMVNVKYDLRGLAAIPPRLRVLSGHLSGLVDALRHLQSLDLGNSVSAATSDSRQQPHQDSSRTTKALVALLGNRVVQLRYMFNKLLRDFPYEGEQNSRQSLAPRDKRGLFNFGGLVLNKLFGTAQASDVSALGKRLSMLSQVFTKQNRLVNLNHILFGNTRDEFNVLVTRVNTITSSLNAIRNLPALFMLSQDISVLEVGVAEW